MSFRWSQLEEECGQNLQGLEFSLLLKDAKLRYADGKEQNLNLDAIWPPFSFLLVMGFSEIRVRSAFPERFEKWANRIEAYQQSYLHDPEYLDVDLFVWDELDAAEETPFIQCVRQERKPAPAWRKLTEWKVPPMEAPLGVDAHTVGAFISEVRHYRPEDTLQRMQAILNEFKHGRPAKDDPYWSRLLSNVVTLSLEMRQLDRAVQIAGEHQEDLKSIWLDSERSLRMIAAYEARAPEISSWASIFKDMPLEILVQCLEQALSTNAGPQIVKLMSVRASLQTEELTQLCFRSKASLQKILLQWLTPYWKPKHYRDIFSCLQQALGGDDLELTQLWLQALLRSYNVQALGDLKKFFAAPKWIDWFKGRSHRAISKEQKSILETLAEYRSTEVLKFLKEIKPFVKGETADRVEKLIATYRREKIA